MTESEFYNEEKKLLVDKEKDLLMINLLTIYDNLKDKESVDQFLLDSKKEEQAFVGEIDESKNKCIIWFNMKILGIIFMTLYITGIYVIIGLKDAVWKEIKASASLHLSNTTRTINETFYENYNQINLGSPQFSLYFMTSSFSGALFDLCGFYKQTIIFLILNSLLFFGVAVFDFHVTPEDINEKYSVWQFLYLVLIYALLYIFIGLISMLPHYIFNYAFYEYEKWEVNKKRRRNNLPEIDKNNKMKDNEGEFNGYFTGFFISILVSMALKNILNQYIIVPNAENISIFYGTLLGCYCIPIILALLVFILFSKIFNSTIKKNEDPTGKTKSGCRFCGYVFYTESEPNPEKIKCEWMRKGFRKCYVNCFCYNCCCFKCLACKKCCGDEKDDHELSDVKGRDKKICIIYKVYGKFAWLCDLVTNRELLGFSLLMFYLQLINYGFRGSLSNYLSKCKDSERNVINLLSLAGILFFYYITVFTGCIFAKATGSKITGESNYIGFGLVPIIFNSSLVSFIISLLSYYDLVSDTVYYLIPFSIGSIEFYLILLKQISRVLLKTELISFDSLFSVYLAIWNFFSFILDVFDASISGLILTQFILSVIATPISLILMCCTCIATGRKNKNKSSSIENSNEDVSLNKTKENLIEEKDV